MTRTLVTGVLALLLSACAPTGTTGPARTAAAAPTTAASVAPETTPTPELPAGELGQAIRSATDYLNVSNFSRQGLIDQLEYEGFSVEDATAAVDSLDVDWNEQAVGSARAYLEISGFSLSGLIEQLEYEGYTTEQATYGANQALNN